MCNPKDQPNTIGIRGSMPGDGNAKDIMYMRFRVQYLDATTNQWIDLSKGADSGFVKVGSASSRARPGAASSLRRPPPTRAFTLRGEVVFQWRKATRCC